MSGVWRGNVGMSKGPAVPIPAGANNPTKIDWADAERQFVESRTPVSIARLAKRLGVSNYSAYRRARRERWFAKRGEFAAAVAAEARRRALEESVQDHLRRWRGVRRLVDVVLDQLGAAADPVAGVPHLLALLRVEADVLAALPPNKSRDLELREHVEQALALGGLRESDGSLVELKPEDLEPADAGTPPACPAGVVGGLL